MARQKRLSKVLEASEIRIASLTAISEELDLGNSLTLQAYKQISAELKNAVDKHNTMLSEIDASSSFIDQLEEKVSEFSQRMLSGVGVRYGKDSLEYEKAGGKRTSEIKRPGRTPKSPKS